MTTVGFIGLGAMGLPMAKNLAAHGFTVRGFDMRTTAVDALAQGSGAVFEEGWQAAASTVTSTASSSTLGLWQVYASLHDEVLALEQSGKYAEAVALATTLDPSGPTAALDAFDESSQIVIDRAASDTTDALRSGNSIFLVLAGLTLLLGLGAAGLATWGIAQRRREYA